MLMLDTNICIYIIKKKPETILKHFKLLQVGDVCISAVTLAELRYGVEKSQQPQKNQAALEEFILPIEVIAFDETTTHCYGRIKTYLEKKAIPIGAIDLMIAAHAQSLNSILVTHNKKEFSRIPGLTIENWARQK